MADNSYELVKEKREQLAPLHKRQDEDTEKIYQEAYRLKIIDDYGKEKIVPDSQSITMNDEALTVNTVESWILSAKWQTLVDGDIPDKQKTLLEDFLTKAHEESNEMRVASGEEELFPFVARHICSRGWIADRVLWQEIDRHIYLDITPVDVRYFVWDAGKKGLIWGANTTFRTASDIESEYEKELPNTKKLIEVVDFWDEKVNEIWIDGKLWEMRENKVGSPPFNVVAAPEGFVHLDKDYIQHKGESVLFLIRNLTKYNNMLMSIDLTMAIRGILQPTQIEGPPGGEEAPTPKLGQTITRPPESGPYELVPQADVNIANRQIHTEVTEHIKMGGVADIDRGSWQRPAPASALLVTEQAEIRNRIQAPRLKAIERLYSQSDRMAIKQFIKFEYESGVGRRGRTKQFSYKDLGDPDKYSVSYRLMSRSKKHELTNAALAGSLRGTLPEETIFREVLLSDEPEKEIAKLYYDRAVSLDPLLGYIRAFCKIIDMAEAEEDKEKKEQMYLEAESLVQVAEILARQRNQPQPQPQQPQIEEPKPNNQLLSLLGGARSGGLGE